MGDDHTERLLAQILDRLADLHLRLAEIEVAQELQQAEQARVNASILEQLAPEALVFERAPLPLPKPANAHLSLIINNEEGGPNAD